VSGVFYNQADWKPHRVEYGLNAKPDAPAVFADQVAAVCEAYQQAPVWEQQGVHVMSTEEKTGSQARERAAPTLPMKPGWVERPASAYIRHGTQCLIAHLHVATGEVVAPSIGATRTEDDCAAHIAQTIATDPAAAWLFIAEQLNIHQSETFVRVVARACGIEEDWGEKEKRGVWKSMKRRAEFLSDASQGIRLLYTPQHTSGLNHIELWFSILVRRLLQRGNFTSVEALRERIFACIDYFNKTMAKPFKWTYRGRPLMA
jgi:hypothetical protein